LTDENPESSPLDTVGEFQDQRYQHLGC
jgi:hypothetical protein